MSTRHPIQPLYVDRHGRTRFKRNAIVEALLDCGPLDMNGLAILPFEANDREQFAQLIGYSLDGFGELSYVTDETYDAAAAMPRVPETTPHPVQPVVIDERGRARFKPNAIVIALSSQKRAGEQVLPRRFPTDEWLQYDQLMGDAPDVLESRRPAARDRIEAALEEADRLESEWKTQRRRTKAKP